MSLPRAPNAPVGVGDQDWAGSPEIFAEVRRCEPLKDGPLGLRAELPRKPVPAMAHAVGLAAAPSFPHGLAHAPGEVAARRAPRLPWLTQVVGARPLGLWSDDTGAKPKGPTTEEVARPYIGHLGTRDDGRVFVNADGIVAESTFPGLLQVVQPRTS